MSERPARGAFCLVKPRAPGAAFRWYNADESRFGNGSTIVSADQGGVRVVGELIASYEAWQANPGRPEQEGPARLLALVEAVRKLCVRDGALDEQAVAALRDGTGLDFRVEGDAVMFELADDKNPGKTQTIAVRAAEAGFE